MRPGTSQSDDHSAARLRDLSRPGSALFCGPGTWLPDAEAVVLCDPEETLTATSPDQVTGLLQAAEAATRRGRTVALALSYEAGAAFGLETHAPGASFPLAWAGIYPPQGVHLLLATCVHPQPTHVEIGELEPQVSAEEHAQGIAAIRELIRAGDTYQVNYTFRARLKLKGDPLDYFMALHESHPVPYAAYLNLGDRQVMSLSPELLLRRRGRELESRPMKGTRPRGRTPEEDRAITRELSSSEKDRAENLMIVDMVRNDLGRICTAGSVTAPAMFTLERYRSLWQMTSTVTGVLAPGVDLVRIVAATFPGASVTGAPKVRTMQIIRELEAGPRGLYTGAIALLMPNGDFTANLPIRTLVHRDGECELGIGAGIVWDSDATGEYQETLLKASFALRPLTGLALYETIRHRPGVGSAFLEDHLRRMAHSAEYWGMPFSAARARDRVQTAAAKHVDGHCVVRLELHPGGELQITTRAVPHPPHGPVRVKLSAQRTDSRDRLLMHKTSLRGMYDAERAAASREGFFEVIFCNTEGRVTEGAITNLFVRLGGVWYTPPIYDGLLPGIWRARFMADVGAHQRSMTLDDLAQAEGMLIGNSVRGGLPVGEVIGPEGEVIVQFGKRGGSAE